MPDEANSQKAEPFCIRTTKVYDWCFKNGHKHLTLFMSPPINPLRLRTIFCTADISCSEKERTPTDGGLAYVTLLKDATLRLQFISEDGLAAVTERHADWEETILVCAPEGTTVTCTVQKASCTAVMTSINPLTNDEIFITVDFDIATCQDIQVTAPVKVCVDSTGYCVPDVCQQVKKPFPCPPTEFFPPQCNVTDQAVCQAVAAVQQGLDGAGAPI